VIQQNNMQQLLDEINRRHDAGSPVCFWLRDDDAVEPSAALTQFTGLTQTYAVPSTLAVIPSCTGTDLSLSLVDESLLTIAVHGWSHTNYAPADEKKQELGSHRSNELVTNELSRGFDKLSELYPKQFVPLLVPPWNRISAAVVAKLPTIGFKSLSTFGPEKSALIHRVNTHVDLIDWKGTRGGRLPEHLIADLIKVIRETDSPVGFLTHHLVHDAAAWRFLEALFEVTAQSSSCRWVSVTELMPPTSPDPGFPA